MASLAAQRGQVLPLVAMSLVLLMGAAGLAIDVGFQRYEQRIQQSAADSAAIAGAAEINFNDVTAAARKDATSNGFTDNRAGANCAASTPVCVQVNWPPAAGAFAGSSSAVEVVITTVRNSFFEQVFNLNNLTVSTRAVAKLNANTNANCLYLLNPNGTENFNGMTFNGPSCGIGMDGSANFNGANINAASVTYSSTAPNENGATFSGGSPAKGLPALDPCEHIAGCAYLAANPPSTTPCMMAMENGKTATLSPGCYMNMNLNGAHITLSPGVYVINGSMNTNGATITGNGVTFYVTSRGSLNFNGANINLSPPTTGNTMGVLFYQNPANTSDPNFNGATNATLSGLLYFPTSNVNYNGSSGNYTVLVFGGVNFNGSTQTFPGAPANNSLIQEPVLAE